MPFADKVKHTQEQEKLMHRQWVVRRKIKNVEERYASFDLLTRRNIHAQGAKSRFLLAGTVQFIPSLNTFAKMPISTFCTDAHGPSEMCPVIDMFEDVRNAQQACEELSKRPKTCSISQINELVTKAENTAWCLQVLLAAVERGGDTTPPLAEGRETVPEFCVRLHDHYNMVRAMPNGDDGRWTEAPANTETLSTEQMIGCWNGVCYKVAKYKMPLEQAIAEMRKMTCNIRAPHPKSGQLAWKGQVREWFEWKPKLGV